MRNTRRRRARAAVAGVIVVTVVPATALAVTRPANGPRTAAIKRSTESSRRVSVGRIGAAVAGRTVTISGTVSLSPNTAAARRRVRVVVQLNGRDHAWERRTVRVGAGDTFTVRWRTLLTGRLTLTARASVSGTPSGVRRKRTLVVTPPPTSTRTPAPAAPAGQPMLGLFQLTAGSAPLGQSPSGSYVEMLTGSGAPLPNLSSPSANKDFTTFTPGVDGGLSTVAYEPAPSPAFAGGTSGNALADDIVAPVGFEGTNFSVETSATDVQTSQPDPIPQIYDDNGTLSGQVTAWDAQWNGQSFNQGTPKPDGTTTAPSTPVSGTYDAVTGAFTLSWRSLIIGGPFNGYSGSWHLAGTFVPASP